MMIAKSLRIARSVVPLALAAVAACSDSNGPGGGGGLTVAQQTKLYNLFYEHSEITAEMFGSGGGMALPFMLSSIRSIGTIEVSASGSATLITPNGARQAINAPIRFATGTPMAGSYRAFGTQLVVTVKSSGLGEQSSIWTGFIAVNNLNDPTELITAGISQMNSTVPPTSISAMTIGQTVQNQAATASYVQIDGEVARLYAANSGSVGISDASFNSGTTQCPGMAAQPMIKVCKYTQGTVEGSFNFAANRVSGTGGESSVTVPSTSFEVPAVQFQISIDMTSMIP